MMAGHRLTSLFVAALRYRSCFWRHTSMRRSTVGSRNAGTAYLHVRTYVRQASFSNFWEDKI